MKYFCNPVNMEYRYQMFQIKGQENLCEAHREAADPSIIYFKGRYYLFPSMSAGFCGLGVPRVFRRHPDL